MENSVEVVIRLYDSVNNEEIIFLYDNNNEVLYKLFTKNNKMEKYKDYEGLLPVVNALFDYDLLTISADGAKSLINEFLMVEFNNEADKAAAYDIMKRLYDFI